MWIRNLKKLYFNVAACSVLLYIHYRIQRLEEEEAEKASNLSALSEETGAEEHQIKNSVKEFTLTPVLSESQKVCE